MAEKDNDELANKFSFPAEVLPDNERTAEIKKKRAEADEQRRIKQEEMRQLRE
jgi:hypothetical protein